MVMMMKVGGGRKVTVKQQAGFDSTHTHCDVNCGVGCPVSGVLSCLVSCLLLWDKTGLRRVTACCSSPWMSV